MLDTLSGKPATKSTPTNTQSNSIPSKPVQTKSNPSAPKPVASEASPVVVGNNEPQVSKGRLGRGIRRLASDLAEIKRHPLPNVTAENLESDLFEWHANMEGPSDSLYAGIIFHIIMQLPPTYPFQPPKLFFCSYLKHDHVFGSWICLDMLQEFEWASSQEASKPYTGWTTAYSVHSVLLQLQSFLFENPNTTPEEIAKSAQAAANFRCSGCPHDGSNRNKMWPTIQNANPSSNQSTGMKLAKGIKKPVDRTPFQLPEPKTRTYYKVLPVEEPKPESVPVKQPEPVAESRPVDQVKQEKAEDDWIVVSSKRNQLKPTKFKAKSIKSGSDSSRQQTTQSAVKLEEIHINNDLQHVEDVDVEQEVTLKPITGGSNAAKRKNQKRKRKLQRIKEQQQEQQRQQQIAARLMKLKQKPTKIPEKSQPKTIQVTECSTPSLSDHLVELASDRFSFKRSSPFSRSLFAYLDSSLIEKIFGYLHPSDLARMNRVCREFYWLANSESIWKNHCIRYFGGSKLAPGIKSKQVFMDELDMIKSQLFCFHTRKSFTEDILGIPISYERNRHSRDIQYISSSLDLLSREGFVDDQVRKSVWKQNFTNWLPLYITPSHANLAWSNIEETISTLCDSNRFQPWMVLQVLPKLMNTMVVSVMSGETHASIVAIEGYCAFHHMFIKLLERYPQLTKQIDEQIVRFIREERYRTKDEVPALGEFLPLLSVSEKISWRDVSNAYIREHFDRNALWIIKKYPDLKFLDKGYPNQLNSNPDRMKRSLVACSTSMKLLMFHVYFLNFVARPRGSTLSEVARNYDMFYGRPTLLMKERLQVFCKRLNERPLTWSNVMSFVGIPDRDNNPLTLTRILNQAVENSRRKRYHH